MKAENLFIQAIRTMQANDEFNKIKDSIDKKHEWERGLRYDRKTRRITKAECKELAEANITTGMTVPLMYEIESPEIMRNIICIMNLIGSKYIELAEGLQEEKEKKTKKTTTKSTTTKKESNKDGDTIRKPRTRKCTDDNCKDKKPSQAGRKRA